MTPDRKGRSRLTRDMLRELLRELVKEKPAPEGANPIKLAEEIATSPTTAGWLKEQGEVSARADMSPLDKIATITTALVAKLRELEVLAYFTDGHLARTTQALTLIVTQCDADELHAGLRDRVLDYVHAALGVGESDDPEKLQPVDSGISKVLTLLRFEQITADQAMSLLVFYTTWLACELGMDMTLLRQEILTIDNALWEVLSPYIDESELPAQPTARA